MMARDQDGSIALAALGVAGVIVLVTAAVRSRDSIPVPAQPPSSSSPAAAAEMASPKWDTVEVPSWNAGVPMRAMDREIVAAILSGHVDRTSMSDLFPDRPYQVRLAGSAAARQFRWVLIDLNRDGAWDERWDLGEPGQIQRTVTRDPDARGSEVMYTLVHGRWQPH
jgi:hypothetical protein